MHVLTASIHAACFVTADLLTTLHSWDTATSLLLSVQLADAVRATHPEDSFAFKDWTGGLDYWAW